MKLLFDQNLSPHLVHQLSDLFPGSQHVRNVQLSIATDAAIWEYAALHKYCIVSKDADFQQRALLLGHPPKVVWLRLGNCSTAAVAFLLRSNVPDLREFDASHGGSFLILGSPDSKRGVS